MKKNCNECGYPLNGNEEQCPECGTLINQPKSEPHQASSIQVQNNQHQTIIVNTDWAHYFYECGVIGWESFKKYASFTGRASRREFFSLNLIFFLTCTITYGLAVIVFLLPLIGVWIRRMHDINKCGWWSCCPIACVFLVLKRSDIGDNKYGIEEPARNLL